MELVITLILAGFLLIFLETYLPGMIAGMVGALCIGAGVLLGYTRLGPQVGTVILTFVAVAAGVGFWAYVRYFPETRYARKLISQKVVGDLGNTRTDLIHKTGVAHTNLHPCGTAVIDGRKIDVISEGSHVERGTAIKVVAAEGLRVVVRPQPPTVPPSESEKIS